MKKKIWFTSDTHFYHRNIAGKGVSRWSGGWRTFKDEFEMTDTIINNINKYVGADDVLYHLGDWSFGGIERIEEARKRIICQNIVLYYGNHDGNIRRTGYYKDMFMKTKDVELLHFDKSIPPIFCSHYAHRVWDGSHKGWIHLYGHSHDSIPDYGKSMDVGVDSAYRLLGEYRPFSLEEILEIMNKREIVFPDHHEEKTNVR